MIPLLSLGGTDNQKPCFELHALQKFTDILWMGAADADAFNLVAGVQLFNSLNSLRELLSAAQEPILFARERDVTFR